MNNVMNLTSPHGASQVAMSKNQINIVAKKRPPPMPIKTCDLIGIDSKRKVLYRNFHSISGKIYLVEISRNQIKVFIILFPNFEAPDIFVHEIMYEKKAQKLMVESNNMFENLIQKFKIVFGKLQIEGYHGVAQDPRRHKTVSPTRSFANKNLNINTEQALQQNSLAHKHGYSNDINNLPDSSIYEQTLRDQNSFQQKPSNANSFD